jgi:hypothetical protein
LAKGRFAKGVVKEEVEAALPMIGVDKTDVVEEDARDDIKVGFVAGRIVRPLVSLEFP